MDRQDKIINRLTKKYTKKSQIMDYVESVGGTIRRKDLIKFIVELKGKKYNPIEHRGYWSEAIRDNVWKMKHITCVDRGYLMKRSKNEPRHLEKIARGIYQVVGPRYPNATY